MQTIKVILLLIMGFVIPVNSSAQDKSVFEQWLQNKQGAFTQFKDARDKAFLEKIQVRWMAYKAQPGIVRDSTPKPTVAPIWSDNDFQKEYGNLIQLEKPLVKASPTQPKQSLPMQRHISGRPVLFDFFGDDIELMLPKNFNVNLKHELDDDVISQAWGQLARSDYDVVIDQLHHEITAYQLEDWGTIQLVLKFANAISGFKGNDPIIQSWFLLNRLGMDVRVARSKSSVFLLLPIKQQVFEVAFLTERGKKYYIFTMNGGVKNTRTLYTYKGAFDPMVRSINVDFESLSWKKPQLISGTLGFQWKDSQFSLMTEYAEQDIQFYRSYPLLGLERYFDSNYRFDYQNKLVVQLHDIINGRPEVEALNLILRFVQSSFKYETDRDQFGQENYLLPTEMLHYRASDCEDRSILFAWLVKELFGYKVIGLKYPGHVATAVAIKGDFIGDTVEFGSQKYLIADPTYINANMGVAMKSYRNLRPELL